MLEYVHRQYEHTHLNVSVWSYDIIITVLFMLCFYQNLLNCCGYSWSELFSYHHNFLHSMCFLISWNCGTSVRLNTLQLKTDNISSFHVWVAHFTSQIHQQRFSLGPLLINTCRSSWKNVVTCARSVAEQRSRIQSCFISAQWPSLMSLINQSINN